MKVMCIFTPCGPSYVRAGWGRAFSASGHKFRFWIPAAKSAFDAFSEYEPDIFIGTTYDLDRAMCKNIARRPEMKVGLFASAWGERIKDVNLDDYPIVVAQDEEKRRLEQLKKETGKPDFVFIHVTDKYLEPTMGGWRDIGIEPVGILNAADTFIYSQGEQKESLVSDIAFVGGYWPYKAKNINKYLLPILSKYDVYDCKVFGNQPWPVPQYLGLIDDNNVKDLFASAVVCPNVSEPHSTDLGWDIIERPFKIMSAGGLCISDHVDEVTEVFSKDELITCENERDFAQTIAHYVNCSTPEERAPIIARGQKKVLEHHTYFDRVAKMLTHMDLPKESQHVLDTKAKYVN